MSVAWALFVPACFALNLAPGPNNLLSLNNAARHGFATASLAGGGRLLAFAGMLAPGRLRLALVLHTRPGCSWRSRCSALPTCCGLRCNCGGPMRSHWRTKPARRVSASGAWGRQEFWWRRATRRRS